MKKLTAAAIMALIVVIGGSAGLATYHVSGHYLSSSAKENSKAVVMDCKQQGTTHHATIADNKITPQHTYGNLCDRLTITNKGYGLRLMAFGEHDEHVRYDNVTEKILKKDESFTITLNQAGTYLFHDHLREETAANFTVSAP